jgi:hypothetical protein
VMDRAGGQIGHWRWGQTTRANVGKATTALPQRAGAFRKGV